MEATDLCIVVADRNGVRRSALATALRQCGYAVQEVATGAELMRHLEYLIAVRGRRGRFGIDAASFAVIAAADLSDPPLADVRAMLRRARWNVPVVVDDGLADVRAAVAKAVSVPRDRADNGPAQIVTAA